MDALTSENGEAFPSKGMEGVLMTQIRSFLFHFLKFSYFFTVVAIQIGLVAYRCKPITSLLPVLLLLVYTALDLYFSRSIPVYLVDFSCLRPSPRYRVPLAGFLENASLLNLFDKESLSFMINVIDASGQSEQTYLPPSLHYIPPRTGNQECIEEVHLLYFPVMDNLLSKTKISPLDIDILVVNSSGFCPSPSLTSVIVNRYKMRDDIKTFNLSGMGCSAGAIGIDLARNVLQNKKYSYAVILSGEILSTGWYPGKDRRKLLLNCLFRMGSSAVLLTNKESARKTSKYKINLVLRTNRSLDDKAYFCGFRTEDEEGITGFSVERHWPKAAAETLRANVTLLSWSVLPPSEMAMYILSSVRKLLKPSAELYIPNFRSVIQHYCIPVSGLPVIKVLGKGLQLTREELEPAVMTLHRFGNQSASGMWYETAYMEAKRRVKKGDKIWQVWVGSGTKCNSIIWECLREMEDEFKRGPWFDCIHRYPAEITEHVWSKEIATVFVLIFILSRKNDDVNGCLRVERRRLKMVVYCSKVIVDKNSLIRARIVVSHGGPLNSACFGASLQKKNQISLAYQV
ncbi:3-ketoacyl-CoA synthase 6-like [Aristolochia californica]|uniref:3-ketoacyl-CoA synthase 6-like n=1 Tax=Aristolochia californica TaxID=171875 RepID=UPI0035DAC0D6